MADVSFAVVGKGQRKTEKTMTESRFVLYTKSGIFLSRKIFVGDLTFLEKKNVWVFNGNIEKYHG